MSIPEFTLSQIVAIREALATVIDDGDPTTPTDTRGNPIWCRDWQIYARNEDVANEQRMRFADAVQEILTKRVRTQDRDREE